MNENLNNLKFLRFAITNLEALMHINFGEQITSKLYNFIWMEFKHIRSHLFDSNSTAGFSVEPKFLIEFNGNSSEEKEAINIELTNQKSDHENYKNAIDFWLLDKQREDKQHNC